MSVVVLERDTADGVRNGGMELDFHHLTTRLSRLSVPCSETLASCENPQDEEQCFVHV